MEELEVATQPRRRGVFYGWIMLPLAMLAMFASSPGQTYGVSIFYESIRSSLKLSHGQLTLAYTLGTILGAIPISLIGSRMDRHGMRVVMLFALTAFCVSCLVMAAVNSWFLLILAFCLLRMLGPGTLAFLSSNVLAFWFQKRLGSVESVRQLSTSASFALVPLLNVWLLNSVGWRMAYLCWGIGLWVVLFPLFYVLFRNQPQDVGQEVDDGRLLEEDSSVPAKNLPELTLNDALKTPVFYVVTAGTGLFAMTLTAVTFSLVPILAEQGLGEEVAATTMMISAVMMAVSQLLGGYLADRVKAPVLVFIGLISLSVTMLGFANCTEAHGAWLSGAMMGFAQGFYFSSTQPLWVRYFGRRHLGKIRGTVMSIMVATSSLGPSIAGQARDLMLSFQPALLFFAALPVPVALCSFLIRPPRTNRSSG